VKLRGADVVARALARAGTRHLFALSGNHVMPVFDAALDAKLEIVHVRHEAAAVHMADAWGRLTGEPGIALVTGGPGHANAVGALYTALAAESPLVLLSGHAPLAELGKGAFQEMRQAEMAAPVAEGVVDRPFGRNARQRHRARDAHRGRPAARGRCMSRCRATCSRPRRVSSLLRRIPQRQRRSIVMRCSIRSPKRRGRWFSPVRAMHAHRPLSRLRLRAGKRDSGHRDGKSAWSQ
jgi:hypothetical protein